MNLIAKKLLLLCVFAFAIAPTGEQQSNVMNDLNKESAQVLEIIDKISRASTWDQRNELVDQAADLYWEFRTAQNPNALDALENMLDYKVFILEIKNNAIERRLWKLDELLNQESNNDNILALKAERKRVLSESTQTVRELLREDMAYLMRIAKGEQKEKTEDV